MSAPATSGEFATSALSADALTPFVIEHANIRGALVHLRRTSREILACHPYPAPLATALAELLAASALLASTLKLKGSLVLQLSGEGPVRLLVVECNDVLELRATAQWAQDATAALGESATLGALAGAPGSARLALTLDPRDAGTMYQGIVALQGESVAASLAHYLATSEQLQSRLVLAVRAGEAHGLLVQRLPSSNAEDDSIWERLGARLHHATEILLRDGGPAAALSALFPDNDVRMFKSRATRFACRCSNGRAENALRIAGADEIEAALAERGEVEVICEFCGRRYTFHPAAARALFAPPTARCTRH